MAGRWHHLAEDGEERTIGCFATLAEAELMRSCLMAAGIRASIVDGHVGQAYAVISAAFGGIRVQVAGSQLEAARDVMTAFERGDFQLGEDFDPTA